jgi:hypothetical protein
MAALRHRLRILLLATALAVAAPACGAEEEVQGTQEKIEKEAREAGEKAGEAAKDAGKEAEEAAKDAGGY